MKDDTTNWYEVRIVDGSCSGWCTCDLSECHPGDLVRVNSSDGPGEPFIYVEPPPMFDNLGAMAEPEEMPPVDERSAFEMRLDDGKRSLSLKLTAFSPHRHGQPACPWCGEPFGPAWFVAERVAPGTIGFDRVFMGEHWFEVTCPRCSWSGVFDRSVTKTI
jgi:hypothetical protein